MNYLFNDRNLLRGAILSASNIVSSTMIFRTDNDAKAGSGVVSLSGPYTGAHDTVIEVEILDGSGDSSQVSQPVFRGVGNGTISDVSVTGLSAQNFAVVVQDLGTQTIKAIAPFQGATLRALAAGPQGNLIAISVDPSAIVRTPIDRALQGNLTAGTNAYTGTEWDFGALSLDAAGNIPDDAPRISFGDDPQVYVAFKDYDYNAQQWVFSFSPPPVRDVQQGAVVKAVTGTWGITLDDGTTTENYTGIVTLRDALSDFQSAPSALCEVITPITNNHQPGGMAAMDLSVWTRPLVLSITEDGSFAVKQAVINFAVDTTAPTETVVLRCTNASTLGAEIWSVTGDITQGLPNAVTGVAYASGPFTFTIPVQLPTGTHPGGTIDAQYLYVSRADGERIPKMCLEQAVLGARASNRSFTFTYRKRPPPGCDCATGDLVGGPNADCLGIVPEGGGVSTQSSVVIRQQRLSAAVQDFVHDNTSPSYTVALVDVPWIEDTAKIFADGLVSMSAGPAIDLSPWTASHAYEVDDQRRPTVRNGYRYGVSVAGISGGTEPGSWTTTIGGTVSDGGVTWVNLGKEPFALWDEYFAAWNTEMTILSGLGAPVLARAWAAGVDISVFGNVTTGWHCVPSSRNGWLYTATAVAQPSETSSSEPTFPTTLYGSVSEGVSIPPNSTPHPITWTATDNYWNATTTVATDTVINPGTGTLWKATVGGTTGASEPDWNTAGSITDGSVTWDPVTATDLPSVANRNRDVYFERFRTQMTEVSAAAGIGPSFSGASVNGDGCWLDHPEAQYWWESSDGLLPMFTGVGYHSSKLILDENGKPFAQSTQEFYVGIRWGCQSDLKVGDQVVLTLEGVAGGPSTYQEGDTISIVVAHQDPVPFGGGQLGNDMLTLGVHGSADGDFPPYHLIAAAPAARINSHSYLLGDLYSPATPNGRFYECTQAGTSASSPPTFSTDRSEFNDGTAKFQDMGLIAGYSEGGLAMTIVQGGILFALADEFDFSAIGGHFRWRQDGGSWSSSTVIATTVLVAGLTANFAGGAAPPSWAAGDVWTFLAQAVNGPDQIMAPTDGRLTWTTSTTIGVTPTDNGPASRVAIFDHHIPDTANIVLEGSDDNFSTTPTSVTIEWQARNLFATFAAVTRAKWRIRIDAAGDCFWIFLGEQMQPMLRDPTTGELKPDIGHFTRRRRAAGLGVRAGVGGDILHDVVCADSLDDFESGFDYACANDNRAFGIVINDAAGEIALVRFTGTDIETKEVLFDYQASRLNRYQSFTVPTEALP